MKWLCLASVMGFLTDAFLKKRLLLSQRPCTILLSLLSTGLLLAAFRDNLLIAKGFLFTQLLILIGFIDYKTREIPNRVLIPVVLCGLIKFDLISSMEGVTIAFIIMAVSYCFFESIGGGDVKLMIACAFSLGLQKMIVAGIISFLIPVIAAKICRKRGYRPMAPYIGIGCFLSYLMN